jgi:hypothetical protein
MKQVHVTAAVIIREEKILCVQRGENKLEYISKKWEFPGGKVESGEDLYSTIKREILEEVYRPGQMAGERWIANTWKQGSAEWMALAGTRSPG